MKETIAIITICITVVLGVGGWIVSHLLSNKREILQKRREIRVKYLREAYIKLADCADNGKTFAENIVQIQQSFNDIQLFGNESLDNLIAESINNLNTSGSLPLDDILRDLRNEIREHLKLNKIDGYRWHVRTVRKD